MSDLYVFLFVYDDENIDIFLNMTGHKKKVFPLIKTVFQRKVIR